MINKVFEADIFREDDMYSAIGDNVDRVHGVVLGREVNTTTLLPQYLGSIGRHKKRKIGYSPPSTISQSPVSDTERPLDRKSGRALLKKVQCLATDDRKIRLNLRK